MRSCASTCRWPCPPRGRLHRPPRKAVAADVHVECVDSKSITAGLGTMVLAAARAARDGADVDTIVGLVNEMQPRTRVFGVLDTLDNLKKGGRIGGAQAMLGTMLSIKPCLDLSSGEVEEAGPAAHPQEGGRVAPVGRGGRGRRLRARRDPWPRPRRRRVRPITHRVHPPRPDPGVRARRGHRRAWWAASARGVLPVFSLSPSP